MRTKTAWALLPCLVLACGDDGASGGGGGGGAGGGAAESCIQDPWSCPSGQTCWISADQKSFSCLNSGPGTVGAECQNIAGTPTCGDDLACLQLQGQTMGSCTEYCDPADAAHACPGNRPCLLIQLAGEQFHACEPPAASTGGGGSGAGGSGGGG